MAQSHIDQLRVKNKRLEEELKTCTDLFNNLNEERDLESHDSRRAFMLKAQIYQLERQCMLLSQAQANRAQVLNEIENQLLRITEALQNAISAKGTGPTVAMNRAELMDLVGTLQKLKNSLYKQSTLESADNLRIPSMLSGSKYVKSQKRVDCYKVCKGETDHINLRQVARLEQDLSSLYSRLYGFMSLLSSSIPTENPHTKNDAGCQVSRTFFKPILAQIQQQTTDCITDLAHCCNELLSLSLLYPNAPWSVVKQPKTEITPEKIMETFPPVAQKNRQIQSSVSSLCKTHNYLNHMNCLKLNAVEVQLSFHKTIYKVQMDYLSDLSECIIETFKNSERNMLKTVREPVNAILTSWLVLKEDQSGEKLKKFLSDIKQRENQLKEIAELKVTEENGLLINFKQALKSALDDVEREYKHKFAESERVIAQNK